MALKYAVETHKDWVDAIQAKGQSRRKSWSESMQQKQTEIVCLDAFEVGSPIHPHSDGTWWFWDETWTTDYGPHTTKQEAELKCREYAEAL